MSRLRLKEGWGTYFLLLLTYLLVVWCMNSAAWADGLGLLIWVAILAVTLGLAFAKAKWLPGVIAHILATVIGVFWTLFIVSYAVQGAETLKEQFLALVQRLLTWVATAFARGVNADNIMFVLQMGLLVWILAYLGAWFAFRRQQAWAAIIPAGIIILVNNQYATGGLAIYFVLYLFCALLLIVRVHVLAKQVHWQSRHIAFAPDIVLDFLRDGTILSLLIVAASVFLPSVMSKPVWSDVWDVFSEPWEQVQNEWSRLYAALRSQAEEEAISFGRTMALGEGTQLSDTPFLVVKTPRPTYLRAAVYHTYTGRGWLNTDNHSTRWPEGSTWPVPAYDLTETITQTLIPLRRDVKHLYATGQPISADIPAAVQLSFITGELEKDGRLVSGLGDVSIVRAGANVPPDGFSVVSEVSVADEQSLRQAGTQYPDWVTERYLDLPASLPDRVIALAQQVVQGSTNPYDAGVALERFLRRESKYSRTIEAPPPNADAVDYFLFESKTGYCDYYASAMVVMLRAVGIPARLASGYAGGSWDSTRGGYTVLYSDAHSWPEVFFPHYGWIPFEPTASQPLIVRPTGEQTGLVSGETPPLPLNLRQDEDKYAPDEVPVGEVETTEAQPVASAWSPWVVVAVVVGGLLVLAALALAVWWLVSVRKLKPAERMFARMVWLGRLAGIRRKESETPREFAVRMSRMLGECRGDTLFFANLYNRERFGGTRQVALDRTEAHEHLSTLRRRVLYHRWRQVRRRLTPKPKPRFDRVPIARL